MYSIDPVLFEWLATHLRKLSLECQEDSHVQGSHDVWPARTASTTCDLYHRVAGFGGPSDFSLIISCGVTSCIRSAGSSAVRSRFWKTLSATLDVTMFSPKSLPAPYMKSRGQLGVDLGIGWGQYTAGTPAFMVE